MSDRQPYSDQDVFESLGDFEIEVDDRDDGWEPSRSLESVRDPSLWYVEANRSIGMKTRGYYEHGYPVGAIVHFTAGRSERDELDAEATIKSTRDKYCFFCISKSGKVYQTASLDRWGSHAGVSSYSGLGSNVSDKLVGIEICNAGRVKKTDSGFEPWWNGNYAAGDKRRTIYTEDEVRHVERGDNVLSGGYFHGYTAEQEAALIKLLLWLRRQKPHIFQWKYVLGHDEVSPRRKDDPGGALSWTMPDLRRYLMELESAGHNEMPPPPPSPVPKPDASIVEPAPVAQPEPVPQPEPVVQPRPEPQAATEAIPVPDEPVPPISGAGASETPATVSTLPESAIPVVGNDAEPLSEAAAGAAGGEVVPTEQPVAEADIAAPADAPSMTTAEVAEVVPATGAAVAAGGVAGAAAVVSGAAATPAVAEEAALSEAQESGADGGRASGEELDLRIGPEFMALLRAYRDAEIEFPQLKDITFAQWALESGYGTSELAVRHKNFAGMKWRRDMAIYAREVFYRPAHDPKDSAYCGFASIEHFIKGYWHRLDIRSLPYATLNGGWRTQASTPESFIDFIGPIWAPSGGDNSPLNNGYIKKIKKVQAQLKQAGLLPSQAPVSHGAREASARAPSTRAMSIVAAKYAEAAKGEAGLGDEQVVQAQLVRTIADYAAQNDRDGMTDALAELYSHIEQHDPKLGAQDIRKLVGTLVSSHALRRSDDADANIYQLIRKIEKAARKLPPDLIEINHAAEQIYNEFGGIPRVFSTGPTERLLEALRSACAFDWLAKIADRLISAGNQQLLVRRYYAQALVELGHINAAISVLEQLLTDDMLPEGERAEVRGQLGRAFSQIYFNHVRTTVEAHGAGELFGANLRAAIKYYASAYDPARPKDTYWQGMRLAALLKRADADGLQVRGYGKAENIARSILALLEPTVHQDSDPWEIAAVGESYLVLGDHETAERWFKGLAELKSIDFFKLNGTIRVLEQVWRLQNGNQPGRNGLMALKAAATRERVAQVSITAEERALIRSPQFESNFADGEFLKYDVLRQIVKAGECVAWIKDRHLIGIGSGFLVRGADLAPVLGNDLYLLTNTHVICDPELARGSQPTHALKPSEARIQFEASRAEGLIKTYLLEPRAVWQSPASECDACLLRLAEFPIGVTPATIAPVEHNVTPGDLEVSGDGTPVAVLGHAKGDVLQIGVRGNLINNQGSIVDIGPRLEVEKQPVFLHYDSPTLPGNSGSPVFDTSVWQVIGLHHAGFDAYEGRPRLYGRGGFHNANEGIYIHSIGKAIEKALKGNRSFHFFKMRR
ncbi:MAG: hypothetical protein RLZ98_2346 [Pseudomonadota bacterium]|jgi:N-acetyl-anhydromuramyl-L-alanine amidase AmpD